MRQAVYEEDLATALQLQSKAQKEEGGLTINEHKQLKKPEETVATTGVITMMLQGTLAEGNLNTKPEEIITSKEKIATALMNTIEHQRAPAQSESPRAFH